MCEDYLEAILNIVSLQNRPGRLAEIAEALRTDTATADRTVAVLAGEGYVVRCPGDAVDLTEQGRILAAKVARKHCVLQCFLTEMLGIDTDAASREACTLEHEVSDDTIDRLSSYMDQIQPAPRHRWGNVEHVRPLLDFAEGDVVEVAMIRRFGRNRRLMDLGVLPGERLQIRRRLHNRSIVIRVKGCDIAVSPEIAASILVERSP